MEKIFVITETQDNVTTVIGSYLNKSMAELALADEREKITNKIEKTFPHRNVMVQHYAENDVIIYVDGEDYYKDYNIKITEIELTK